MNTYRVVLKNHNDGTKIKSFEIRASCQLDALTIVNDRHTELLFWKELNVTEDSTPRFK